MLLMVNYLRCTESDGKGPCNYDHPPCPLGAPGAVSEGVTYRLIPVESCSRENIGTEVGTECLSKLDRLTKQFSPAKPVCHLKQK